MPGSSRESPLDSLACCLARVRMACLPHQLTREKLAITRRKPKREPLKMNSKDASSENSFLKIELRVGEEKLQLALPTLPRMRGPRPRGAVVGTWWTNQSGKQRSRIRPAPRLASKRATPEESGGATAGPQGLLLTGYSVARCRCRPPARKHPSGVKVGSCGANSSDLSRRPRRPRGCPEEQRAAV